MFSIDIFYFVYCFISYIEGIPQLYKLIKTKSSSDFSILSIALGIVSCTCWLIYAIFTMNSIFTIILTIVDCAIWYIQAILIVRYRKN